MSWNLADIPDLTGRTAVVTGANGGLGLETTIGLAGAGAHVVMAVRDQTKAAAAVETIRAQQADASLELVPLDLGDLSSVATAAEKILAGHPVIDILVNNAGVMAMPEGRTVDGFETQLGVDHLGHFAFTAHLLPGLLAADKARVVTVTSVARFMGGAMDPKNPHLEGSYRAWKAYAHAKMANYHFGLGLQREFERAGVAADSLIAHPGLSNTDLQSTTVQKGGGGWAGGFFHSMTERFGMHPHVGALPQLRAATDPAAKGGQFFVPLFASNGPAVRRPVLRRFDLAKQIDSLWEVSERETGVKLDVIAAREALGS